MFIRFVNGIYSSKEKKQELIEEKFDGYTLSS